jgi:hypothetical protein
MTDDEDPTYEVEDDDGLVAREKKKTILKSREWVNEMESQLVLAGTPDGITADSLTAYMQTVRRFLRDIEPLLANPDVTGATEAYQNEYLGTLTIIPPVDPNKKRKPEHLREDDDTANWAQNYDPGLVLHEFSDGIEPRRYDIQGLREIIVSEGRTAEWDVIIDRKKSPNKSGSGPERTTVTEFKRWDRSILNNAVRTADQFLENANIGLSLAEGEPSDGFLDL